MMEFPLPGSLSPLRRAWLVLTQLAVTILGLVLADTLFEGLHLEDALTTIVAAALLTLAHTYLRPVIMLLTLPLNVLTLGLFTLVVNGLLLALVSWLLPGFHMDGFWTAVAAALLISAVSILANLLLRPNRIHIEIR